MKPHHQQPESRINAALLSRILIGIACLTLATEPALTKEAELKRSKIFDQLVACRTIEDPTERLACYDAKVGEIDAAEKKDELIIADKEDVREARKGLFGFSLPKIKLFSGKGDDEIKAITSTIKSARQLPRGRWLITLEDGAKWTQADSKILIREPKAGRTILIKKAALGTYMAKIDGKRAFRIKRVN